MSLVSQVSGPTGLPWQEPKEKQIRVQLFDPAPPEEVVRSLASIDGPVDVYCWYEGARGLPKPGALFMKKSLFKPLYELKRDAKLCLYSLSAWDFKKTAANMPATTPLGETINRINQAAIECVYSSAFFQYCKQEEGDLYSFISNELPKKKWLFALSDNYRKSGMTVADLLDRQSSLFDCIADLDVCAAYSLMQYVEGYYLVQESIKRGLLKGRKRIEIAFVLPNDEGKYYLDFPKDLERMLRLDFGGALNGVEVHVNFMAFQYGKSLKSRPYIDKESVKPEEVRSYFDYLSKRLFIPRDMIHKLWD